MQKLNNIGNIIIYNAPTFKLLTNTIVDAIDSNSGIYPHATSASLSDEYSEQCWVASAADVTIEPDSRLALGVFLSNTTPQNQMFSCIGSARYIDSTSGFTNNGWFGFGRCGNSTITASDVAQSNSLTTYIRLPERSAMSNAMNATVPYLNKHSIDQNILVHNTSALNTNPVCFFFVVENHNASAALCLDLQVSLAIRANFAISINSPTGI